MHLLCTLMLLCTKMKPTSPPGSLWLTLSLESGFHFSEDLDTFLFTPSKSISKSPSVSALPFFSVRFAQRQLRTKPNLLISGKFWWCQQLPYLWKELLQNFKFWWPFQIYSRVFTSLLGRHSTTKKWLRTLGKTVVSVLFSLVLGTAGSIIGMSNI